VSDIKLLLADVDGTLVRPDKSLAASTVEAVQALHAADIHFAITSGRPPRGMEMLVEQLALRTPLAGFNGGLIVEPDLDVVEEHLIPDDVVPRAIAHLESFGLSVWLYRGADWFVRDRDGPHVERESHTVQFEPSVVAGFDDVSGRIAKIVGVSDDFDAVAAADSDAHGGLDRHVSVSRSQPYYLDITHPQANKGAVVTYLSERYGIPPDEIATIGDMPNDVLMFAHSGLSIAMGNAHREVQRAARHVTTANDEDGFANAVDRYILGRS
jgi:Cof subfamily protein (haloacid dehalogenase superfamily)